MFVRGLLLGLSNGPACLGHCAPTLVPFLLGRGDRPRDNSASLAWFLAGRLAGYLLVGTTAWFLGRRAAAWGVTSVILGTADIVLGGLLVVYGVRGLQRSHDCAAARPAAADRPVPVLIGFSSGLGLCPPLLLALAGVAQESSVAQAALFFVAFFLGSSLWVLPLAGIAAARESSTLRTVGRLAAVVAGLLCGCRGLLSLVSGWVTR